MTTAPPYLSFRGIGKVFPGVKALDAISFDCYAGQIHALMGENGAGKSTLLRILSGSYTPSQGEILIKGQPVRFATTTDALNAGVAIIYQELHLVPEMTVAENIYLGQLPHKGGLVNYRILHYETRLRLAHLGLDIAPDTPLKYLSIGQWQMVEIAKALARNAKIIAFDEPNQLAFGQGDRTAVPRHSRTARRRAGYFVYLAPHGRNFRPERCHHRVQGRPLRADVYRHRHGVPRPAGAGDGRSRSGGYLRLSAPSPWRGASGVKRRAGRGGKSPISLSVRAGEIVGLFGLVGAGRSELMKGVFGGTRLLGGELLLDGQPLTLNIPGDAIRHGLMLCPEDRKADGIIPVHSVQENINISARRKFLRAGCLINAPWETKNARHHIAALNIKMLTMTQLIMNLSGGNQQKAILGRWLSEDMKVIMLDEPTRGIDVGAKHEIYAVIYSLARRGIAVLFASSDLPEVLGLADRIIVMREGAISGELRHDEATEQKALSLAMLTIPDTRAADALL